MAAMAVGPLSMAAAGGKAGGSGPREPVGRLIFPPNALHNHGSCVVETPRGDLLACWYRGSGERRADDVHLLGARWRRGDAAWSEPFPLADTPGFPDCNPCMFVDQSRRLWLFWPAIIANEWHTALLCHQSAPSAGTSGPPRWDRSGPILLKHGPEFAEDVARAVEEDLRGLDRYPEEQRPRLRQYLQTRRRNAADRYFSRMGWMPRVHPVQLQDGRILLPLYSDGFDFSLIAISDDGGNTWTPSRPIIGDGPVQPALAQRRDGTLVAVFRDNGLPPKRMLVSESRDRGMSWSRAKDTDVLNPGSGVDIAVLRSGRWALVYNDTERGRHSLAVSLSEDEGRTWSVTRRVERDDSEQPYSYAYPSLIQARDGSLHLTYTYTIPDRAAKRDERGRTLRETIKHLQFTEEWVLAARGQR